MQQNSDRNKKMDALIYGKVPPQSQNLEKIILGLCMLEKGAIDITMFILTPESFYVTAHETIFRAMREIAGRNQAIDVYALIEELKKMGKLEDVGGAYYLVTLTNEVVSGASLDAYCRIVQQKFIQRELIRIAGQIVADAYEDTTDVFELLDRAETEIMNVGNANIQHDMVDMNKALVMAMTQVEEWRNAGSWITGVPTGFDGLDRATRGWQPTDLIILAARPSVGKSALALRLVRAAASSGFPVGFFSLEMKIVQLLLRLLSAESNVHLERIQTGRLEDSHMSTIYKDGIDKLAKLKVWFDDSPGMTLLKFRAKCRRLVEKFGVKIIIVDYLQLMSLDDKTNNREQEISKISRNLKMLARELNVPIVALSQLSREIEKRTGSKKKPQLSDLRESGAIEQDADLVMFLWAPDEDEMEQDADLLTRRYLKIAKQRSGRLVTLDLDFQNEIQLFRELEGNAQPKISGLPNPGGWKPVNLPHADD